MDEGRPVFERRHCRSLFMPDHVRANREARRVPTASGRYLVVTFARLERNPVPHAAGEAVAPLFPDDPPRYMESGPVSYADPRAHRDRPPCRHHRGLPAYDLATRDR